MQLIQPNETNKHAEAPATVSQAFAPPSGKEEGSFQGFTGGTGAFSGSSDEGDPGWSCSFSILDAFFSCSAVESAMVVRVLPGNLLLVRGAKIVSRCLMQAACGGQRLSAVHCQI